MNEPAAVIVEKIPEIQRLSSEEKLILAGELWDEIAGGPEAFPPREDHLKLLRERLEHSRKHPEDVISWRELQDRILSSR